MKVPTWKLKPTTIPEKPWYAAGLSGIPEDRDRSGKKLNEDEVTRKRQRDDYLKQLEDPLKVYS